MKDFTVSVRKVTDADLMRSACEMTFLGKSKQSLLSIYKTEHSPVRTQMFWVELRNLPLASSTHILRHHVGSTPYQLSCRDDRNGGYNHFPDRVDSVIEMINEGNLEGAIDELNWLKSNADRQTPVNLGLFLNAQSLIDMSKLRLCAQAHSETLTIFRALKEKIAEVDPELASVMVRKCVYRGGICGEAKCCGFNSSSAFKKELEDYLSNFSEKQRGIHQKNI